MINISAGYYQEYVGILSLVQRLYDVFDLQLRFHIITTISVSVTITLLTNKCTTFTSSVSSVSYYYSLVSLYAYSVSSSLQDQS